MIHYGYQLRLEDCEMRKRYLGWSGTTLEWLRSDALSARVRLQAIMSREWVPASVALAWMPALLRLARRNLCELVGVAVPDILSRISAEARIAGSILCLLGQTRRENWPSMREMALLGELDWVREDVCRRGIGAVLASWEWLLGCVGWESALRELVALLERYDNVPAEAVRQYMAGNFRCPKCGASLRCPDKSDRWGAACDALRGAELARDIMCPECGAAITERYRLCALVVDGHTYERSVSAIADVQEQP
jgi:hypothetical protein